MKTAFPFAALALLVMGLAGWQMPEVQPQLTPANRPPGLDAHESYASASLLGQFRTNLSAWLWVRADLYLHNGTEMRVMTDAEKLSGRTAETEANDGHEKLDHDIEVTVVPPKSLDFRGVFGDIERATSAYKDMHGHTHNDPVAVLPLFRLMTWLDPNFIPGWTNGATIIARDHSDIGTKKALDFLHQGLVNNPGNIEVLNQIAYTYLTRNRDIERATPYLEQARTEGLKYSKDLDEDSRNGLLEVYRWLTLCYRDSNRQTLQDQVAREGLRFFKDDPVLLSLLQHPPAILTEKGLKAWHADHPVEVKKAGGEEN